MRKIQKRIYKEILKSLKDEPEKWEIGEHRATYKDYEIWVSNKYYGTKFICKDITVGSVNPFWFLFPWQWWRVRIIRAVENAQAKQMWG